MGSAFGHLPLGRLDAELLERFCTRLAARRDLCGSRGRPRAVCRPLKAITVRKVHFIFRVLLARAVRWKHIAINEAEPADVPGEPDPPTAEEAAAMASGLGSVSRPRSGWGWRLLLTWRRAAATIGGEVGAKRRRSPSVDRWLLREPGPRPVDDHR